MLVYELSQEKDKNYLRTEVLFQLVTENVVFLLCSLHSMKVMSKQKILFVLSWNYRLNMSGQSFLLLVRTELSRFTDVSDAYGRANYLYVWNSRCRLRSWPRSHCDEFEQCVVSTCRYLRMFCGILRMKIVFAALLLCQK